MHPAFSARFQHTLQPGWNGVHHLQCKRGVQCCRENRERRNQCRPRTHHPDPLSHAPLSQMTATARQILRNQRHLRAASRKRSGGVLRAQPPVYAPKEPPSDWAFSVGPWNC